MLEENVSAPAEEVVPNAVQEETQAEVKTEAAEETTEGNQENKQDRDDKGQFKPKNATQARIDELTRQKHEAAREAAYWKGLADGNKPKEAVSPKAQGKPTPDQFDNDADYIESLTDWKIEQREVKRAETEKQQNQAKTWNERVTQFKQQAPDFDDVMSSVDTEVPPAVIDALREIDKGPAIALHLAKNPEVASKLNYMSPEMAIFELGQIAASLETIKQPVKRTSNTPPPANPIGTGRSTEGDPSKMSMDDYMKWRVGKLKAER